MKKSAFIAVNTKNLTASTMHLSVRSFGLYMKILLHLIHRGPSPERHLRLLVHGEEHITQEEWRDVIEMLETDGTLFWSKEVSCNGEKTEVYK